jgi:hypothetical protein
MKFAFASAYSNEALSSPGSSRGRAAAAVPEAGFELMQKPAAAERIACWLERA